MNPRPRNDEKKGQVGLQQRQPGKKSTTRPENRIEDAVEPVTRTVKLKSGTLLEVDHESISLLKTKQTLAFGGYLETFWTA